MSPSLSWCSFGAVRQKKTKYLIPPQYSVSLAFTRPKLEAENHHRDVWALSCLCQTELVWTRQTAGASGVISTEESGYIPLSLLFPSLIQLQVGFLTNVSVNSLVSLSSWDPLVELTGFQEPRCRTRTQTRSKKWPSTVYCKNVQQNWWMTGQVNKTSGEQKLDFQLSPGNTKASDFQGAADEQRDWIGNLSTAKIQKSRRNPVWWWTRLTSHVLDNEEGCGPIATPWKTNSEETQEKNQTAERREEGDVLPHPDTMNQDQRGDDEDTDTLLPVLPSSRRLTADTVQGWTHDPTTAACVSHSKIMSTVFFLLYIWLPWKMLKISSQIKRILW